MADTTIASDASIARSLPAARRKTPYAAAIVVANSAPKSGQSADHETPRTDHTAATADIRYRYKRWVNAKSPPAMPRSSVHENVSLSRERNLASPGVAA